VFFHKILSGTGFQPVSFSNFPPKRILADGFAVSGQARCLFHFQGKQKAPTHGEKGLTKLVRSSHFPPTPAGAGFGTWRCPTCRANRLPWRHRASPSATRHESVVSTDADKLIQW
jgi:hypothetical protein